MITAIICSALIGLLIGAVLATLSTDRYDPIGFSLLEVERERRLNAERDTLEMYRRMENMRIDNLRLASFPLYQTRDWKIEIEKIPRAISQSEAKEKYGEHYLVTDGLIGKLNEVISQVNKLTP